MQNAYQSNASSTPPTPPASFSVGYPQALPGAPATELGPWWFHAVTAELQAVIVDGGLTPSPLVLTQLRDAIRALIAAGVGGSVAGVSSVNTRSGAVTLTAADVGLSNVNNTSDANKPLSTAASNALAAKQDVLISGSTIKTLNGVPILGAGDISFATGATAYTGLTDAATVNLPTFNTALSVALAGKQATLVSAANIKTVNGVSIVGAGDATVPVGVTTFAALTDKASADLPATNTSLSNALAAKAPLASPTFTGTVGGITKAMVGLSNVDNFASSTDGTFAANSNTLVPTQAAVKAYVDARAPSVALPKSSEASGTLTIASAGKMVNATAGIIIPSAVFSAGDAVSIRNTTAAPITITAGGGLTLELAGTTSTGSRTLGAKGVCTVWFDTASLASASGTGLA